MYKARIFFCKSLHATFCNGKLERKRRSSNLFNASARSALIVKAVQSLPLSLDAEASEFGTFWRCFFPLRFEPGTSRFRVISIIHCTILMAICIWHTWTLENGSIIRQRFCSSRLSYSVFRCADTIGSSSNWALYVARVWNTCGVIIIYSQTYAATLGMEWNWLFKAVDCLISNTGKIYSKMLSLPVK